MSSYKVGNLEDFFKNSQKEENSPSGGGLNKFGEIYNLWMENPSFAEFDSHNDASYKSVFGKFFKKSKKRGMSESMNIVNNESVKKSKKMKKGKKISMQGNANSAEELDISQGMETNEVDASFNNSESETVTPKMSKKMKRKLNDEQNKFEMSVDEAVDGSMSKKKQRKNKFKPNDSTVVNDASRSSNANMTLNEGNEMSDQEDSANGTSASNMSGLSSTLGGSPQKKKRKNKKKKSQQAGNTNVSIPMNESTNNEDEQNAEVNDVSSEKKKKRRKKKKSQTGAENVLNQSNDGTSNEQDGANRKRKMDQSNGSTETDNFADNESDQIEDLESAEMNIDEAPKKKKKKQLNKLQGEDDEDKQAELKNPALSKKEAKLLKKKNKKLKGILPGLGSEPTLTKFSVTSEDVDDEEDADDKNESSDDDDKSSFPRTPNKKFVPKEESEDKLQRTLFVGNLPTSVDQKILKDLFKGMGKVESVRLRCAVPPKPSMSQKVANIKHEYHKDTTSLKGFVVFEEKEDAEKALSLNGTVFNGNHIRVDKAFGPKPQNGTPPSANKMQQHNNNDSLFIGNLPYDIDDETLWSTFSGCGTVKGVRVIRDRATGVGKGFAFVEFEDASSIEAALALEGTDLNGRPMRVKRSENRQRNDGPRQFQNQRNWNGGPPQQRKFGFRQFQRNDNDSGPRKTFKKMNNKRKFEQEKKKVAAIFTTEKS